MIYTKIEKDTGRTCYTTLAVKVTRDSEGAEVSREPVLPEGWKIVQEYGSAFDMRQQRDEDALKESASKGG